MCGVGVTVEGYPDRLSYAPGETASFACSTDAPTFAAEVARVGGRREIVWERAGIAGTAQPTREHASSRGCGWQQSFELPIARDWSSGYYEVVLRATDLATGRLSEGFAGFAVRPDATPDKSSRLLLVLATNTYNAYNDWGGPSLYTGATRMSFQRPLAAGFLHKPEPHVRYPNVAGIDDPEHEHFRAWADQHGLARWSGSAGWHN